MTGPELLAIAATFAVVLLLPRFVREPAGRRCQRCGNGLTRAELSAWKMIEREHGVSGTHRYCLGCYVGTFK